MGDEVIVETGRRLSATVRGPDRVVRLGGDEFLIVFDDVRDATDLDVVTRRVRSAFDPPVLGKAGQMQIRVSIGAAMLDQVGSAEEALRLADALMYREKHASRAS